MPFSVTTTSSLHQMWFSLLFVLLLSIFSHSKIQFCNSPNRLSYFYLSSIYLSPSLCILSVLLPPAHLLLWVHKHRWWNTHICLHVHTHTLPFCSAPAPPPLHTPAVCSPYWRLSHRGFATDLIRVSVVAKVESVWHEDLHQTLNNTHVKALILMSVS